MFGFGRSTTMVSPQDALAGRSTPMGGLAQRHVVLDAPLDGPWPEGAQTLYVGMGCFWGAERLFWQVPGVISTAVGYAGGYTPNPTYEETCTGRTGHTEAVRIVYDPQVVSAGQLLKVFWENHNPLTPNRQGNDVGTQYRSAIYVTTPEQAAAAAETQALFAEQLAQPESVSTEVRPFAEAGPFYLAEDYHQQYLAKNPGGYCNHGPNGACILPTT